MMFATLMRALGETKKLSRAPRRSQSISRAGRQGKNLRCESLEDRRMLSIDPVVSFLPVGSDNSVEETQVGRPVVTNPAALITIGEGDVTGVLPLGFGELEDVDVQVTGTLDTTGNTNPLDVYEITLNVGDILGVAATGIPAISILRDSLGNLEIGSAAFDSASAFSDESTLPSGGASYGWIADTAGTYFVTVESGDGAYTLDLSVRRPVLEESSVAAKQTIFLDFDGETIPNSTFITGAGGNATLSGLSSFLAGWGLSSTDEDDVIDSIVATFEENFDDIRSSGGNGDFDLSGIAGEYDIEILNSRDHADPFGTDNVSRVVIGGTISELGISTIGIAESIDVGNFDTTETGVVLLDLLSASSSNPNSLNQFTLDPSVSIIDLIGEAVGNIASHEAGHFFGTWHTFNSNGTAGIMDIGGNLANSIGVIGSVWGDGDDIDVDFNTENIAVQNGLGQTLLGGAQDSANNISFGLSTGTVLPRVTAVEISGSSSTHTPYAFDNTNVGSGEQLRTVPVGGADTISITFDTDVTVSKSDLTLIGLQSLMNPDVTTSTFNYDAPSRTATWTFTSSFAADQYLIQLSDNVEDSLGVALDGEWTNPAALTTTNAGLSTFPSGDGATGGDFEFVFTILQGDTNRDNAVTGADFSTLSANFNGPGGFAEGDSTGDGNVTGADFSFLSGNFNRDLALLEIASDFNNDYAVDTLDLDILGIHFGQTVSTGEDGDVNGDAIVDLLDLDGLSIQFGIDLEVLS